LQSCKLLITKMKTCFESGFAIPCNFLSFNNLAERVGFEFTRKRSFNNIERAAGIVKQWKTMVSSANGSQTDHSLPEGGVIDRPRRI
jgi:hypothetical protein